ncbi:hypothetical protein LguiB_033891 [Lonicera macranthoides]
MASRIQKRMALRRKLHILRNLTHSKSVKKSSILKDAFIYIYKLKLQLEAIKNEYLFLMQHLQEVKVEKVGKGFVVKVTCKKGEDLLVKILEAIEEKGMTVVQASVACNYFFCMEAIVEAHHDDRDQEAMDAKDLTQALVEAIDQKQSVDVSTF